MARRLCMQPSSSKENQAPPSKRLDFGMDDNDFQELAKGFIPPNTIADTRKCVRLFEDWATERNARFPGDKVPDDILATEDHQNLSLWLCKFCTEIRKVDGTHYPPRSIQHYLMGIQRHIRVSKQSQINFFTDSTFISLWKMIDALYRKLHSQGIGCTVNKTETPTDEDEDKLWQLGILNPETLQGLLNCMFFLNGKNFCLRRGAKHCDLKTSQLQREVVKLRGKPMVRYTYTEHISKNRAGGLKQIKQANKVVHQYKSEDLARCHVLLLDKYLSKLPTDARQKDNFHLTPKAAVPTDTTAPWFTSIPVGRNVLGQMMKTMAAEGKLEEKAVTNHILRSYGASKMFGANVPEKLIMERSGHRSLEGVRQYERTSTFQELQVCKVLDSNQQFGQTDPTPRRLPQANPSLYKSLQFAPQPICNPPVVFQGCTFSGCTFQLSPPPLPQSYDDNFSDVDIQDCLEL